MPRHELFHPIGQAHADVCLDMSLNRHSHPIGQAHAGCVRSKGGFHTHELVSLTKLESLLSNYSNLITLELMPRILILIRNSFSTSDDTRAYLAKQHEDLLKVWPGRKHVKENMHTVKQLEHKGIWALNLGYWYSN